MYENTFVLHTHASMWGKLARNVSIVGSRYTDSIANGCAGNVCSGERRQEVASEYVKAQSHALVGSLDKIIDQAVVIKMHAEGTVVWWYVSQRAWEVFGTIAVVNIC